MKSLRPILIGIVLIAAAACLFLLPVKTYLRDFLQWVDGLGVWGPVLVAAVYVPATVLFIPGSIITLGAGAIFGVVVGTVAVSIGSTLGSTCAFLIARFAARDWVAQKVAGSPKFAAIDRAVGREGFKIVLLTRLSPVFPYNLLGYLYGITNVKLRDYFLASWVGMIPGTVLYVYLGSLGGSLAKVAAGEAPKAGALQWSLYALGFIATVFVTVLITRIATRAMRADLDLSEEAQA
ncbi:MAG: hypothetical protein GC162_15290 [Planctomycetes bacterium]|nr:hypothetical protein [Planctomycetota bacterium]